MQELTWPDYLFLLIVMMSSWSGFKKGIIRSVFGIIGLFFALWISFYLMTWAGTRVCAFFECKKPFIPLIGFASAFLLSLITIELIIRLSEKITEFIALSFLNKLGGAAFGFIRGIFITSLIFFFLMSSALVSNETIQHSFFGKYLSPIAPFVFEITAFFGGSNILSEIESFFMNIIK